MYLLFCIYIKLKCYILKTDPIFVSPVKFSSFVFILLSFEMGQPTAFCTYQPGNKTDIYFSSRYQDMIHGNKLYR